MDRMSVRTLFYQKSDCNIQIVTEVKRRRELSKKQISFTKKIANCGYVLVYAFIIQRG